MNTFTQPQSKEIFMASNDLLFGKISEGRRRKEKGGKSAKYDRNAVWEFLWLFFNFSFFVPVVFIIIIIF